LPPRWWHLYDDPVLDGLEEQAWPPIPTCAWPPPTSPARARHGRGRGGKEVDFGVSAGAQHARLSGQSYLQDEQLPVADIGDVGAEMNYQIDLFGRIRRQIEAARADEEALAATQDAVKVTVAADVARLCRGLRRPCCRRSRPAHDHLAGLVEINRRLVAAGRNATPDVTAGKAAWPRRKPCCPPIAPPRARSIAWPR
jgi:hypothetical protein